MVRGVPAAEDDVRSDSPTFGGTMDGSSRLTGVSAGGTGRSAGRACGGTMDGCSGPAGVTGCGPTTGATTWPAPGAGCAAGVAWTATAGVAAVEGVTGGTGAWIITG